MKQAVLANFDLPWLPITALVIFVASFLVYCFWTFKRSNQAVYREAASLPLADDVSLISSQGGTRHE